MGLSRTVSEIHVNDFGQNKMKIFLSLQYLTLPPSGYYLEFCNADWAQKLVLTPYSERFCNIYYHFGTIQMDRVHYYRFMCCVSCIVIYCECAKLMAVSSWWRVALYVNWL